MADDPGSVNDNDDAKGGFGTTDSGQRKGGGQPDSSSDQNIFGGAMNHDFVAASMASPASDGQPKVHSGVMYSDTGGREGGETMAGGEGEGDEEDYEDPEEMIREFGRHPMMDRVQEALYNQLLQTYERVSEELRDKDADVKK